MSETATSSEPLQEIPEFVEGMIEMPPSEGWVVHEVAGKPQATSTRTHWAWCKVTTEGPGYTEIVFTEADGTTFADPYPKPTADGPDYRVRLGPVLFKVFC